MQIYKKINTNLSKTLILQRLIRTNMSIFSNKQSLEKHLKNHRLLNESIGFVPTMGALHQGHLSLIKQSLAENHVTVVSIFVNPTQFNNPEDLKKYPRTLEKDYQLIQSISEKVLVFTPNVEEMYSQNVHAVSYDFQGLEKTMEGKNRPGHFDGVGTIVSKLFDIVLPNKAYFGEKDFQQLQIIRKLVEIKNYPIEIIGCPIFRHSSGLAMSSRNELLSEQGKNQAKFIYQTLEKARENFSNKSIEEVKEIVHRAFKTNKNFNLEYFEIAEEKSLKPELEKKTDKKYRGFLVAHLENVRLIDNISLN